jgi:MFS-type transporter involved in bile tolerance (Atg22 family)
VRTKPLIGRKAWFGPRRLGWGLSPVSAEGWVVTVVAAAGAIVLATLLRRERWTALLVVVVLLVIVFLKGTSPGGPREWDEFQASKNPGDG